MEHVFRKSLVPVFLDFGEAMLTAGAEIGRVENSLSRIGSSFGAISTEVFVITSSIVLTLRFEEGEYTGSRRVVGGGNNFERLRKLNALSRRCVSEHLSSEELKAELQRILEEKPKTLKIFAGSALAAGSFALFFGGNGYDAVLAALFGLFICYFQVFLARRFPNKAFFLFSISFLSGLGISLVAKIPFLPTLHVDRIMIGDIMLLIPGIATTMSVRDVLVGDTISGITKFLECLLWAVSLAAGFVLALVLCGR